MAKRSNPPQRNMSRISQLLSNAGLGLKKSLGQNFLVNEGALRKIAEAASGGKDTLVVEVGAGLGNLTEQLAERNGRVISVELDERFKALHQRELGHLQNIFFHYGDFLEIDLESLIAPHLEAKEGEARLHFVGNIPYHITSPILFKLIESSLDIDCICLLMQREVGHRLAARRGSKHYGILAIKAAVKYEAKMVFTISPGSFLPPPKVHSSLVKLTPRPDGPLLDTTADIHAFFNYIDAAFSQRRKFLSRSLANGSKGRISRESIISALEQSSFKETVRAEELSPEEHVQLYHTLDRPKLET
ncbi:MAG: 16S rRNA (adenine(1518)-N(6)/adenine(1519)-N(6))-dimethyltransferase RsmA, partial [Candidatus Sumerlaeota bacterium]